MKIHHTLAAAVICAVFVAVSSLAQAAPVNKAKVGWCEQRYSCRLLAEVVVYEARNQSMNGQYAVANVVMNRVKKCTGRWCTVHRIVHEPSQFSYLRNKKGQKRPKQVDWQKAYVVAFDVLNKKVVDNTGGALYYHTTAVKPHWASGKRKRIDSHWFYASLN